MNVCPQPPSAQRPLREIWFTGLKLGCIGFGGIAGMIATMENEIVEKKKWVDHHHFLDIVSASNILPGPNSVEIIMHCGYEKGGKAGLVLAGLGYIIPATLICICFGYLYVTYGQLPAIQDFFFGIRPATTALVMATVYRLCTKTLKGKPMMALLTVLVFAGALMGVNEILLIAAAGVAYALYQWKRNMAASFMLPLLFFGTNDSVNTKLFLIFLKIGAILYGSGYVLFAYMNTSLVENNHWLTPQQLTDAIAVGQLSPGPILSSATFAGYLISGPKGGLIATAGIFLPSFFISFFMQRLLTSARKSERLRSFLDGLNAASIAVIAAVGFDMLSASFGNWREMLIMAGALIWMLAVKNLNTVLVVLAGGLAGYLLLHI